MRRDHKGKLVQLARKALKAKLALKAFKVSRESKENRGLKAQLALWGHKAHRGLREPMELVYRRRLQVMLEKFRWLTRMELMF